MTEVDKTLQKSQLTDEDIQKTVVALMSYSTRTDQADALEISRQALYKRLLNHPEIESYVDKFCRASQQIMCLTSVKAVTKLVDLVEHGNPKISLKASCEVLDRVGIHKGKDIDSFKELRLGWR